MRTSRPALHKLTTTYRIQNPLAGLSKASLLHRVEEFAKEKDLVSILPLLKKGSLVARDPTNYEDIDGDEALDEDEIESLRDEVLHKWRQPTALYFTIICCSIGAAVQGWDETGTILLLQTFKIQAAKQLLALFPKIKRKPKCFGVLSN